MLLPEHDISLPGELDLRHGINWGLCNKFRRFYSWIIKSLACQTWM